MANQKDDKSRLRNADSQQDPQETAPENLEKLPGGYQGSTAAKQKIRMGMDVIDVDGKYIGQVREIRPADFLVMRDPGRDFYAPYNAIKEITPTSVILNLREDQADEESWYQPELTYIPNQETPARST